MATLDERFARLVRTARNDPSVVGLALIGSRGKGFGTAASDHDVMVLMRGDAPAERHRWYEEQAGDGIELWTATPDAFARQAASWGSDFAWDICGNERYAYADATILVDKTEHLRPFVDRMGFVPAERRVPLVREALDVYVSSLSRSLNCLRDGSRLGAWLEAADSIGHAVTFVVALERWHWPYYGYLERERSIRPLGAFPLPGAELVAMIDAIVASDAAAPQQRLFAVLEPLARQAGCGDKYDWIKEGRGENLRE